MSMEPHRYIVQTKSWIQVDPNLWYTWFEIQNLIIHLQSYRETAVRALARIAATKPCGSLTRTWESTKSPTSTPISSNPDVWTAASCRVSGANIKVIVIWWGGLDGGVLSLYVRRSSFSEAEYESSRLERERCSASDEVYLNNASGRRLHEAR